MDENANSTNVDGGNKDKYSEDLKNGTPGVLGFCEQIENDKEKIEIAVDPNLSGKAVCNSIAENIKRANETNDAKYLPMETPVHVVSREELDKLKATLKARQAAQEEERLANKNNLSKEEPEK